MIVNEYRTNMRGIIIKSILIGLPLAILCGIPFLDTEFAFLGIIIGGILIPGTFVAYVLSNKLIIRINQDDIDFIWGFKPIQTVLYANNTFTTYTYRLRLQFVFVITTRYLRVTSDSGEQKDYSCSGLSKKQFEEFASEVINISNEKQRLLSRGQVSASLPETGVGTAVAGTTIAVESAVADVAQSAEQSIDEAVFLFPKKEFSAVMFKSIKMSFIITGSLVLLVALVNPGFLLYLETTDPGLFIAQLLFALALFVFLGIVDLLLWMQYHAQVIRTPDSIRIIGNELLIDDQKFVLWDIKLIKMTQERFIAQDKNRFRTLKINVAGKQKKYFLGHMNAEKKHLYYQDYGKLCSSLNDFLKQDNRFVIYETT
jgi:hypothetical protein